MSGVVADAPLIVAANRDELLDRPAVPMTVLRAEDPRILGGRDQVAGGTWLAVNEHGVVAGLTNQPSAGGRDPSKRSRGELPLAFARYRSAAEAVEEVCPRLDPADYNPCWMLIGDRDSLYFLSVDPNAKPERLEPGLYVLENAPLRPRSAKAAFVTRLVNEALLVQSDAGSSAARTVAALETVLGSHQPAILQERTDSAGRVRPPELSAPCVHVEGYGTRSAMTVRVPVTGLPSVRVADGRPCEHELRNASGLWSSGTRWSLRTPVRTDGQLTGPAGLMSPGRPRFGHDCAESA
jgi:uncharacterized protein with NRDE domain